MSGGLLGQEPATEVILAVDGTVLSLENGAQLWGRSEREARGLHIADLAPRLEWATALRRALDEVAVGKVAVSPFALVDASAPFLLMSIGEQLRLSLEPNLQAKRFLAESGARDVHFKIDLHGLVVWSSVPLERLPQPVEWLLPAELAAILRREVGRSLAAQQATRCEVVHEGRTVLVSCVALEADALCFASLHIDASAQSDGGLLSRLEVMHAAERVAGVGSWRMEAGGGLFQASPNLGHLLGREGTAFAVHPNDLLAHMHRADHEAYVRAVWACITRGEDYDLSIELLRVDGEPFWSRLRGRAERAADGKITAVIGTVEDITDRVSGEARLAALADNLPDGVIYRRKVDLQTFAAPITYVSKGVLGLVGLAPADMINAQDGFLSVVHEEDRAGYIEAKAAAMRARKRFEYKCRINHARTGELRWVRVSSRLVKEGADLFWDGLIQDVTAEHKAHDILQTAKETAERAEQIKAKFVALMGHEVRSPMSTILGMARQLERTELSAAQRRFLGLLEGAGHHLLNVLNDLLDYSKMSAGKFEIKAKPFLLEDLLRQLSVVTSVRAADKNLELTFVIHPDVPEQLEGDILALGQVLINLVTNAIKFTQKGEVSVWAFYDRATGQIRFEVRDTGAGIAEELQSKLFQPFVQGEVSGNENGTGLGLSICHELVTGMGGQIGFESTLGVGTTFHATIPLPAVEQERSALDLCGQKFIVVSRSPAMRQSLEWLLTPLGAEVQFFGGHAEIRANMLPDGAGRGVLLVDLPNGDSLDAEKLRELRLIVGAEMQVVMLVSPTHGSQLDEFALERGIASVQIKPPSRTALLEWCGGDEVARKAAIVVPDFSARTLLIVDDNVLNREVIGAAVAETGANYAFAENGKVALDLMQVRSFDAVLLDFHMPVMDGPTTLAAIRADSRLRAVRVLALTAAERGAQELQADGFDAYLMKPFEEQDLYKTLESLWAAPSYVVDLDLIRERFSGSEARALRTIAVFATDFAERCAEVQSAEIGLDRLGRIAHSVKGTAAYVGAGQLEVLAVQLDQALMAGDGQEIERARAAFAAEFLAVLTALQEFRAG